MSLTARLASRPLLLGAALVALIAAVYAPALRGEFLWDDDLHVTANPTIIGPLGLKEIWTSARANYFPLVLTNFWVQHALWGLNPLGYHVVTLACHALAALLLWRVLAALRMPGAWLGAALWALHPVQVESVAWICELKNTQSAVFFLAAILMWIRWLDVGAVSDLPSVEGGSKTRPTAGNRYFVFTLVFAILAILSKPSTVMLPVVLALLAWWFRRKIMWRDILFLVPFFALSAVAAGWTIWEQKHHSGALGPEWSQSFAERIAIAGRVVWFYLGKLAWPEPLIFIYPRWQIDAAQPLAYVPFVGVVAGLALLWWKRNRGGWPVLVAAGFFVALLFPVLGFFNVYFFRYSFVGDHFQYLASMGPLALAGAGVGSFGRSLLAGNGARWHGRPAPAHGRDARATRLPAGSYIGQGLAVLLVVALGVLTARQCLAYRNNEALWRDTLAKNPNATMAWLNLGDLLAQQERYDESVAAYRRGMALAPHDPDGWNDVGNILVLTGRAEEAAKHFEHALRLKPDFVEAHSNYGNALRMLGRSDAAMTHYRRALELKPTHVEALNNLGAELAERGRPTEALPHFQEALRLNPQHAGAHDNLGNALRGLGRVEEALAHHADAVRLKPDWAEAHANYGRALLAAGRVAESLREFERALELKPALSTARGNYAHALAAAGRPADAFAQLERAVELAPASAEAQHNLGTALAQSGRVDEALARFEHAVRLAPRLAVARTSLATALGARARWRDAIPHLRVALELEPEHAQAHAQLAVALVNSEQLDAAVPVFEAALRLNPNSAELHDNFGQLLRALRRNREAFEHFEKAAELRRAR